MRLSRGSRWFLVVCVAMLAGIGFGLYTVAGVLEEPEVEPGQEAELTVEPGQALVDVGVELVEIGVLSNARSFASAAEGRGMATSLAPGGYELETGMAESAVLEALAEGPDSGGAVEVTIPEGLELELTLERIAEGVGSSSASDGRDDIEVDDLRAVLDERTEAGENAEDVLELPSWVPEPAERGDEVREPYEGLLWPETYRFAPDESAQDILQTMIDELGQQMRSLPAEVIDDREERDLDRYDLLTIASLIEREVRLDDERHTVSGVIANRLAEDMRLQLDATVLYALGQHQDRTLTSDTEVDSPYNTYEVEGLPPTPISGVGTAALEAAAKPAGVDFRFYVLSPECDGSHRFAETVEEHQENVAAFREADNCQ